MKLICLNVWGGRKYKSLIKYVRKNEPDVYCFQEVLTNTAGIRKHGQFRADILNSLMKALPKYRCIFAISAKGFDFHAKRTNFDFTFGQAIFVKKTCKVLSSGSKVMHSGKKVVLDPLDDFSRILQYATLQCENKKFTVFNFHGLATWPKSDTPARIKQSRKILAFIKKFKTPRILCGDFNLTPEAKSLRMLEAHMTELVKTYKIKSTRVKMEKTTYPFSDFFLVDKGIIVQKFKVPNVRVSDHLPLVLEFEIKD